MLKTISDKDYIEQLAIEGHAIVQDAIELLRANAPGKKEVFIQMPVQSLLAKRLLEAFQSSQAVDPSIKNAFNELSLQERGKLAWRTVQDIVRKKSHERVFLMA